MEILRRLIGLVILLVIEAVSGITTKGEVTSTGESALWLVALAVGCVLAGYFLRTWWALLIVPVVFWASTWGLNVLFGNPLVQWGEGYFSLAVMVFGLFTIPVVLLALLGTVLGKRLSGGRATIAA